MVKRIELTDHKASSRFCNTAVVVQHRVEGTAVVVLVPLCIRLAVAADRLVRMVLVSWILR